jgi:tetratricopeptide (TPR) repeat protein
MYLYRRLITCFVLFLAFNCSAQDNGLGLSGYTDQKKDTVPIKPEEELYKSAVKLMDSARYKEAKSELKKAVKINEEYYPAFNKLAQIAIKEDNIAEADIYFRRVLNYDPNNFEALKTIGIVYFKQERWEDCKMFFDSAAAQRVEDAEFYYYRAKLMFVGKSYKDALDMANYCVEKDPKYYEAYILKADCRIARKEYNHAIKELNDAVKLIPADKPNYDLYRSRAKAKFEMQDYKGAVTDWNVYIDAVPGVEEAYISRAAAKININDNSGAVADLDEAIKLKPKNPVSYNYRGVAKGGLKQYVEALKDLDKSIKLKFDYASAYVNRAAIKLASKDKYGACQDLNKADSLGDSMAFKLIEKYCK